MSIIVVAFNEARNLRRLYAALAALKQPGNCRVEVILVDGGSLDGTAELARRTGFGKVIEAPGASIPACRNRGLKEAAGDWIAFLDADCEPASDWLEQAAPLLEKDSSAILGWPVAPPSPMTWVQAAWHFHWQNKNRILEESDGRQVVRREEFRLVTTRNMWLHKTVAEQLGGFDERLATGEDTDFAFRAHLAGIPVLGVPGLRVVHHGEPATLLAFFRQQLWHANRLSYSRVFQSGQQAGRHAPLFSLLFAAGLLLLALAIPAGLVWPPAGWLPALFLPALVAGPAACLCLKMRQFRFFPALCVLYFAYGLARAIDLAGLHQEKKSWKSARI
ncbi:MAG: glycosyltransferase [Verrucomicrobia bacterium]|nr:glycosyltransferase [Verrucomicrobiota bacterium]